MNIVGIEQLDQEEGVITASVESVTRLDDGFSITLEDEHGHQATLIIADGETTPLLTKITSARMRR